MKKIFAALLMPGFGVVAFAAGPPPPKPKIIVAIVVHQFRYDYLLGFRKDYTAGLKTLLERGAVFDDAHHIHYPIHYPTIAGVEQPSGSVGRVLQEMWQ